MRNTPFLRIMLLAVAFSAVAYDILFLLRLYSHPDRIGAAESVYGYWALPVAIVFFFLYSYANKKKS